MAKGRKKHTKQTNTPKNKTQKNPTTTEEEMFAFKIVNIYCSLLFTLLLISYLKRKKKYPQS